MLGQKRDSEAISNRQFLKYKHTHTDEPAKAQLPMLCVSSIR
jgi:hypothetical protein